MPYEESEARACAGLSRAPCRLSRRATSSGLRSSASATSASSTGSAAGSSAHPKPASAAAPSTIVTVLHLEAMSHHLSRTSAGRLGTQEHEAARRTLADRLHALEAQHAETIAAHEQSLVALQEALAARAIAEGALAGAEARFACPR